MPARLIRTSMVSLTLLGLTGAARALPPLGAFSIDLGGSYSSLSTQDIEDLYAPLALDKHKGSAAGLQGGLLYNVSDSFQIGAGVEKVFKRYKVIWSNGDVDTWNIPALGFLGRLRWLMPSVSPDLWFALGAAAGQYGASGASLRFNTSTWNYDFSGSTFGGIISLDSEYRIGAPVSVVAMIGYRLATIRNIKATLHPLETTVTLLNGDNSKAAFDYSGPFLSVALRFYFGGDGSSVTSQ